MAYDFPASPSVGTVYEHYRWNGVVWKKTSAEELPLLPTLTTTEPLAAIIGDPPMTVAVCGTEFWPNSRIIWDGVQVVTTYIGPTELHAIADPNRDAGNVPVTVNVQGTNIAPALTFVFGSQPVPTLTSITPNTGIQAGSPFQAQLIGTNMRTDSEVLVDNVVVPFTYVSATELTATITPPPRGGALSSGVKVVNDGASSNTLTITYTGITVTGATVTPIAPTQMEDATLRVTGTLFTAADKITANGIALTTTFVSATELTAIHLQPYGIADAAVNVYGSVSPDVSCGPFLDPRCTIKSTYPDYWSEWFPVNQIEVWTHGPISDNSVCYLNGQAKVTRMQLNGVGTEFILIFDMEGWPANDGTYPITVLNNGGHWSTNSWMFYVERIG